MHAIKIIAGGFLLLGVCLFIGYRLGGVAGLADAAKYFVPIWLIATGISMWVGVAQAGYSTRDEAPMARPSR